MARTSEQAGYDRVIGFDMGGTSTDVSHYAGEFERELRHPGRRRTDARAHDEHPHRRGGRRLRPALRRPPLPGRPRLGGRRPRPGLLPPRRPAHRHRRQCDARPRPARPLPRGLRPGRRPAAGRATPSASASPRSPTEIAEATGDRRTPEEVAAGFLEIAVLNMANAVKKISVQRGHDITRYALTSFGGAGGQHACAVADALGIDTVARPAAGRGALRVRHRARRRHRHARAVRGGGAGRGGAARACATLCAELAGAHPRRTARRRRPGRRRSAPHARVLLRYAGTDAEPARRRWTPSPR